MMLSTIVRSSLAVLALALMTACASMPTGRGPAVRGESHAEAPSAPAGMGRIYDHVPSHQAQEPQSGFRIISAGLDGLLARVELIDAARHSLDLQYYIFRGDESGLIVASALLRAADRGVRVRIIVDDGETLRGDEKILALSAHPGIEVRLFNPFRYRGHSRVIRGVEFLIEKSRLDYRMHNKLLVADNFVALIGGRNIGDQYFQVDPDSQFGDDDVVTAGPIVQQLSGTFDEFWNSPQVVAAPAIDRRHTTQAALADLQSSIAVRQKKLPLPEAQNTFEARLASGEPLADIAAGKSALSWSQARLVYDSPDKKRVREGAAAGNLIYSAVAEEAKSVSSEMVMVTPYMVPTPDELVLLHDERGRNARVRLLTNSLASAPDLVAHAGYMHYRPALLEEGVELHEVRAQLGSTRGSGQGPRITRRGNYALHAKLYVFDRKSLFIGSMNFDQRSRRLNTEIGLIIRSPPLAQQTVERFEALTGLDNAYTVEFAQGDAKKRLVWKTREAGIDKEYEIEPARNEWQRFRVKVLSWLPLDKEL